MYPFPGTWSEHLRNHIFHKYEWKVKDKVVAKIKFTNSLTQQTESTETEEPSQGDTAGTEAATENGASETIDGTESAN